MERFTFSSDMVTFITKNLSANDARSIVASLIDALYGDESDEDWSADTFEAIASMLHNYRLTPDSRAVRTSQGKRVHVVVKQKK